MIPKFNTNSLRLRTVDWGNGNSDQLCQIKKNTIECVVQLISPYMIDNTFIVISIASGFIGERDEEFEWQFLKQNDRRNETHIYTINEDKRHFQQINK